MALTISTVTPNNGANIGETFVQIIGTDFGATQQANDKVYFNNVEVKSYDYWSDTELWVITDKFDLDIISGQVPQDIDVKVTIDGVGTATKVNGFSVYQKESVRERILDYVKYLIENIVGISYPDPDDANSDPDDDIEIETGGDVNLASSAYNDNEWKQYTIEVTTGGASGTAEVSITDIAGNRIVTSNKALPIGNSGAFIKFTFTGSLTLGDKWYIKIGPYKNTFKHAIRWSKTGMDIEEYPSVLMHEPVDDLSQAPMPLSSHSESMMLEVWDIEPESFAISTHVSRLYQDIITKIQKNYGMDCLAVNTVVTGAESFTGPEGQGLCGIAIKITIQYRFTRKNPTVPIGQA